MSLPRRYAMKTSITSPRIAFAVFVSDLAMTNNALRSSSQYSVDGRPPLSEVFPAMVKTPGAINGGFYQKMDNPLSHPPSVVISVQDIKNAMKAVEAGGGKILGAMDESGGHTMEPQTIPGVGLWISFQDTEGNRVSLLQPGQ